MREIFVKRAKAIGNGSFFEYGWDLGNGAGGTRTISPHYTISNFLNFFKNTSSPSN